LTSPRGRDAQEMQLWPLVLMALLGAVGCVAQPAWAESVFEGLSGIDSGIAQVQPQFGEPISAIDLDENIDPRIRWLPQDVIKARIRVLGEGVALDGRRPRDGEAVRWGAYVRSRSRSWARIELSGTEGECEIQILELKTGGIIGTTERCAHEVELPQGNGRSRVETVYALRTGRNETEIAVVAGGMELRLSGGQHVHLVLRAREYAVMRADSITRHPLDRETEQRLTGWRKTFPPLRPPAQNAGESSGPSPDVIRRLIPLLGPFIHHPGKPPRDGRGHTGPQPAGGTDGGTRPRGGHGREGYQLPAGAGPNDGQPVQ